MKESEKFNELLKSIGGNRVELANEIGIKRTSANNQLAKGKKSPKWAKSMLYMARKIKQRGI